MEVGGKGAIKLIILELEEMGVPRMFEEVGKLAKSMMEIKYTPIGIVHSPFKETKGTPIQPNAAKDG
ncbi:hypothetical protein NAAC61_09470 [Petrotoga sp. 8T1HF07.NaAc.6.1]|nr:hypothetical protein [Petrotoga sp. 8T1HF07.NaAc.6.1]